MEPNLPWWFKTAAILSVILGVGLLGFMIWVAYAVTTWIISQ